MKVKYCTFGNQDLAPFYFIKYRLGSGIRGSLFIMQQVKLGFCSVSVLRTSVRMALLLRVALLLSYHIIRQLAEGRNVQGLCPETS